MWAREWTGTLQHGSGGAAPPIRLPVQPDTNTHPAFDIESAILTVRAEKVLLDSDLAAICGVPTFRFNEAVKRNPDRFPEDFRFQLTREEWQTVQRLRSRSAILKTGRGQHRKFLPYAFTEPGTLMAANVLNSPRAVRMNVFVVRAFVKMRDLRTKSMQRPGHTGRQKQRRAWARGRQAPAGRVA